MFKKMFAKYLAPDEGYDIGGDIGAEEPEVAELGSEEGAEELEVAEPVEEEEPVGRTAQDSAWAELRRRAEEAERLEQQNRQMQEALGLYFNGEDPEDLAIQAKAQALEVDPEILRAQQEAEYEKQRLAAEKESLENELMKIKVERMMEQGLAEIQSIDPKVKSLEELGSDFANYIRAGLSSKDAYYAVKAKELKEKKTPPKAVGKVESSTVASDYYSKEEVEAMSDEEISANYESIKKSMKKWK